jgi:hypothetical protein
MRSAAFEEFVKIQVERIPIYEATRRAIEANIDVLDRAPTTLFSVVPTIDGKAQHLPVGIEKECAAMVIRKLKETVREINENIARIKELAQ